MQTIKQTVRLTNREEGRQNANRQAVGKFETIFKVKEPGLNTLAHLVPSSVVMKKKVF
jgi:hypothetical protein